jgi:hypothetical protein
MSRKIYLQAVLQEAIRVIKEANQNQQTPAPQAPAASPVPPSPVPPAGATNGAAATPPTPSTPASPGAPSALDLDSLIDRLNVIRGGKSFADPEVYGQLTTFFKNTSDADKTVIDNFLQNIGKIVIQVDMTQQNDSALGQQPNQQPPAGSQPAMGAQPAAPAPTMQEEVLHESVRSDVKFKFGEKEFDFGSPEHVRILKGILHGLQNLRDCYEIGSANRHVYAAACVRLGKLILKYATK